jgi:hypothetical protein
MENQIVPPSFLFQFSIGVPQVDSIPRAKGRLLQLDDASRVFVPGSLNQTAAPFDLKMAWNSEGVGIEIEVRGKKMPPAGRRRDLKTSDFVTLFLDTRHTANVHRATEFCSSLIALPCDEDADEKATVMFGEIAQQRTVKRDQNSRACRVQTTAKSDGYILELWIPGITLTGFDEAPGIGRIGFYCVVHDTELGEMPLSIGGDFPVAFDPSTWLQLELKT